MDFTSKEFSPLIYQTEKFICYLMITFIITLDQTAKLKEDFKLNTKSFPAKTDFL